MTGVGAKQICAWLADSCAVVYDLAGLVQKVYGARNVSAVAQGSGAERGGQAVFAFVPAVLGLCAWRRCRISRTGAALLRR